mgnify:CR=1 FL=1
MVSFIIQAVFPYFIACIGRPLALVLVGFNVWMGWANNDVSWEIGIAIVSMTAVSMFLALRSDSFTIFAVVAVVSGLIPILYEWNNNPPEIDGTGSAMSLLIFIIIFQGWLAADHRLQKDKMQLTSAFLVGEVILAMLIARSEDLHLVLGFLKQSELGMLSDVLTLSYAVSLAGFLQLLILLFFVRKNFKPILTLKINIDEKTKFFFRKLLPSIFSSGVTQINILIGTIIASFQAGAVSYLYYADRVYQLNLAVAGIAVGTVMLPELSKYVKNNNYGQITNLQNRALELCLFLSVPAATALVLASEQIITSLFGYGSFNNESVINTSIALTFFAFGVPAFSILKIFSNFFFARNDTKTPFYLSVISVTLNIVISVSFFSKLGFVIIPIATSISSWINVFMHFYFIKKRDLHIFDDQFIYKFPRMILSVVVMGIVLYLLLGFFSDKFEYNESWKFIYLFIIVITSLISYFLISNFSGAFKFKDIKLK